MLCHTEPPGGHFIKRLCMSIIRLTHTDSPEFPDSGKSFKVSVISLPVSPVGKQQRLRLRVHIFDKMFQLTTSSEFNSYTDSVGTL